jgi:hypothetical protein
MSSLKLLNTKSVIPLSLFKMFMGAVERQPSRVSLFGDVTSFPLGLLVGWSLLGVLCCCLLGRSVCDGPK